MKNINYGVVFFGTLLHIVWPPHYLHREILSNSVRADEVFQYIRPTREIDRPPSSGSKVIMKRKKSFHTNSPACARTVSKRYVMPIVAAQISFNYSESNSVLSLICWTVFVCHIDQKPVKRLKDVVLHRDWEKIEGTNVLRRIASVTQMSYFPF